MAGQGHLVIDLVLRVQTIGRDRDQWLIQTGSARERVPPLTDEDLRRAALTATPAGRASILPACADTWDGLLAHLRPNDAWLPGARILELVGRLIHDHLIRGRVADYVHGIEARARAARVPLRHVVHVFEGEEDGLLPRLPFELMHRGGFWFRRAGTVGVRLSPDSAPRDVHLRPGAKVLVAASHTEGRAPSAAELAAHVDHVADTLRRAGFVARTIAGCTPAMLESALRDGCDLLYLVCHGDEDLDRHGRLALSGGDVTGRQLGEWLEAAAEDGGQQVQAALLCACWSAVPGDRPGTLGMAAHLASGERRAVAALGFRAPVEVTWGLAFMTQVFEHLASGTSLELAVARARQAQSEDDPAWSLPLLFAPERDPFPRESTMMARDPTVVSRAMINLESVSVVSRGVNILESVTQLRSLLPVPPRTYFTARSTQLAALRAWRVAPGAAVLTALAGEGGVGKTEIARKVAHDAHDTGTPVIWLERPDRQIGGSLAAMIRQAVPEYRPPDTATIDDLRAYMTRELGPHRGLLVLDDVEQASAVATLTPGPTWNVLVTTRQRSLLAAVVEIDVEPLDPDDAVELLARIAQDGAAFEPDEASAARDLVIALGGLPLAIELAGDLVRRGVSLDEIRHTAQSPDGLTDDSIVGRVERVMARSLAGLAAGDEAVWAMVAALPSAGATEQDVALGLDEPEARAGRRLFRLRQANLLRLSPAQARYTMHPLARQIARQRAHAAGTWETTLTAAAKVVRAVAEWCVEPIGRDSELAFRRWRSRRDFLDTLDLTHWPPETAGAEDVAMALRYADTFRALERVPEERATLLDTAIYLARSPETLAQVHKARGELRRFRDDLDGAEADYAQALELFTAVQSNLGLAQVHKARGDLRWFRNDLDGTEADYARALELFTAVQSNLGLASAHKARGELRQFRDDLDGAEADYARALELYTAVQDNLGVANVHKARGELRRFRDDLDGAEVDHARALELYTAVQDHLGLANVHQLRGDLRRFRDDLDGAEADYARALELYTAVQSNLGLANVLQAQGDLHAGTGALDRAESFYLDALRLYERVQDSRGISNVLAELAQTRKQLDDRAGARAYAQRAEPLARASHNRYAVDVIARVLAWARDARDE